MVVLTGLQRRWEVRPTLRLTTRLPDTAAVDGVVALLGSVEAALRTHPNVVAASVELGFGDRSEDISATIALTHPSTPGTAVDEATTLLAEACAAAGLTTDMIKEVVAEMADVDPRSL